MGVEQEKRENLGSLDAPFYTMGTDHQRKRKKKEPFQPRKGPIRSERKARVTKESENHLTGKIETRLKKKRKSRQRRSGGCPALSYPKHAPSELSPTPNRRSRDEQRSKVVREGRN